MMLLKIFFFLSTLFSAISSGAFTQPQNSAAYTVHCEKHLQSIFDTLTKVDEVNELLDQILQQGNLSIQSNRHLSSQFEGYWSAKHRTIYLTKSSSNSTLLTTLLFEMHNAVGDDELAGLDHLVRKHQISRDDYIRSVEWWEYKNAKATSAILEKGIKMGIFPKECRWILHDQFEDHLAYQNHAGHSSHIGRMYDKLL